MNPEDKIILKLILKDIEAINFVYRTYGPALYGIIYKHSSTQADIIFKRSFCRVVNTARDYDSSKCRLFTWMYKIVMEEIRQVQ